MMLNICTKLLCNTTISAGFVVLYNIILSVGVIARLDISETIMCWDNFLVESITFNVVTCLIQLI